MALNLTFLNHCFDQCPIILKDYHHHHVHYNLEWYSDYLCENLAPAFSSLQNGKEEVCG